MKKSTTENLTLAALFVALIFVITSFLKIPSPFKGYINLGDCVVLLAAWKLPPKYSFLAAGIGSALADLLGGFVVYAPATFFIKGIMALIAYYGFKYLKSHTNNFVALLASGTLAELFMIFGYFLFESFLYGYQIALVNVPVNAVQGVAGLIVGIVLVNVLKKVKILNMMI